MHNFVDHAILAVLTSHVWGLKLLFASLYNLYLQRLDDKWEMNNSLLLLICSIYKRVSAFAQWGVKAVPGIFINLLKISHKNGLGRQFF